MDNIKELSNNELYELYLEVKSYLEYLQNTNDKLDVVE